MRYIALLVIFFFSGNLKAEFNPYDQLVTLPTNPYRVTGTGFVTDASHPMHPGDFYKAAIDFRLTVNPEKGEALIEIESGDSTNRETDTYYFRRGRIFQTDSVGVEVTARPLGDVSLATVAALHPDLVTIAMRERPDMLTDSFFAWNDELWTVIVDPDVKQVLSLSRNGYHDLFGDFIEEVNYTGKGIVGSQQDIMGVRVSILGRETLRITFSDVVFVASLVIPDGDLVRDRARVIGSDEISFTEIVPHLFTIDIASMDTRVTIAEFTDYLFVIEGVYNSRNCDLIAQKVHEKFKKPVKYFAFSHLHGQYIGGVRSWVAEGATVLVPPTTAPMVDTIVSHSHSLRPDALSRSPRTATIETIVTDKRIEDATNTIQIYNIESQHTDEYLIFYFPTQKILLTGDLLFYRPGQPLKGRSKKLCETVQKLGLDVEKYYCTWPLNSYGTKNVVTREEMEASCSGK